LTELLVDAGESEDEIEFIDPEMNEESVEFSEEDCIVIPLEEATAENEPVEKTVLRAAQKTCVIIGVWAPDEKDNSIHPAVAKYGAAQIPWDSGKLRDVLDAVCPESFETPEGAPSNPHKIKYNKCG
jgi:hypothetical protein